MTGIREQALRFSCGGEVLLGVLTVGEAAASTGVLIVVGGPQYRAGSHRQFTLLARHLAAEGIPALRFDYRGMGDSEGERRSFESVDEDIGCALDRFFDAVPGMSRAILWGLCDAASAAMFYGHRDPRVAGLVLVNPWVRTEQGQARAYLGHYYGKRLLQREFWRKIVRGEFRVLTAGMDFARSLVKASGPARSAPRLAFQHRMREGLHRFPGNVLMVLSGDDLTAQEFKQLIAGSDEWRRLLASPRVERRDLPEANHTFSRRAWRDQLAGWTSDWVKNL